MSHSHGSRGTFFIGTLNNIPDVENWCTWQPPDLCREAWRACRWQHEIAPDPAEGRAGDHIQIFVHSRKQATFKQLNELLGFNGGWKQCDDVEHAINCYTYCSEEKPDSSTRHGCASQGWGSCPTGKRGPGKRTSTDAALEFLESGKRLRDLLDPENAEARRGYFLHPAGFERLHLLYQQPRNVPSEFHRREVIVFYGRTGVGKTRRVFEEAERAGLSLFRALPAAGHAWYDGLDDHDSVLFDGKRLRLSNYQVPS